MVNGDVLILPTESCLRPESREFSKIRQENFVCWGHRTQNSLNLQLLIKDH